MSSRRDSLLKAGILFVLWVSAMAGAFWYLLLQSRQWFDSTLMQPPSLSSPQAQQALQTLLLDILPGFDSTQPVLIRLRQENCRCERFIEPYHRHLQTRLQAGFQVHTLEINDLPMHIQNRLSQWIPATPSALVFDHRGRMAYLGPYHQDDVCSAENSFLEPVIAAVQRQEEVKILNTLVYGCFCSLPRNQTSPY